ncbi:MAG: hypothetical protein HQL07_00495 [Nitrospirae bacterium]|nr:hypothetical protein [Magnetococcales bacterium]
MYAHRSRSGLCKHYRSGSNRRFYWPSGRLGQIWKGLLLTAGFSESEVNRLFANLEKQVRFAAAQALTKTAQDAQAEVRRQLPERFTTRTGWLAKGIRVRAANKTDLTATVSVLDQFMVLQETGGIKEKQNHAMSVPVGARSYPKETLPRSKWPSSLLQKKGYFIAPITGKSLTARSQVKGNYRRRIHNKPNVVYHKDSARIKSSDVGNMALWHRRGRRRLPIDLVYVFKDKVSVDPRFDFRKTVMQVARERFSNRFVEALKKALATAR